MRLGKVLLAAAACGATASTASAAITAQWVPIPITPAAIAADSTLATQQTWSLVVNYDAGFWASAGMRAVLPAGNTFYRNENGGDFRPSNSQQTTNPALTHHTYVTSPRQSPNSASAGAPAILGGFPEGQTQSFGGPDNTIDIPGTFSISWGDPQATSGPAGPQTSREIARLTFPQGVLPVISNTGTNPSNTSSVNPDSTVTIPDIPEPTAMGFLAAAGLLAIRRRQA